MKAHLAAVTTKQLRVIDQLGNHLTAQRFYLAGGTIGILPAHVLTHPNEVRYLTLTNGVLALIDADWYDVATLFFWTQGKRGLVRQARFDLQPTGTWLARLVAGDNDRFTHVNGNPLDCRRCNLVAHYRRNRPYRHHRHLVVN
jgi:hypothetical protein